MYNLNTKPIGVHMKIYYLNTNLLSDKQISKIYSNAELHRQTKYNAISDLASKKECIAVDALIKLGVRDYLPFFTETPKTIYSESGKLVFTNVPLYLSVTHTSGHVLLALDHSNIGIDAEYIREINFTEIHRRFFKKSRREPQSLLDFYNEWTSLEARFKCEDKDHIDFSQTNYHTPVVSTLYNGLVVSIASRELVYNDRSELINIIEFSAEEL